MFVVAYQKILQLSYVDKFLNDVHLEFRDRFKNDLQTSQWFSNYDFNDDYQKILASAEQWGKQQAKLPKQMRTFDESLKSKKTVASMIERKDDKDTKKQGMRFRVLGTFLLLSWSLQYWNKTECFMVAKIICTEKIFSEERIFKEIY